MTPPSPTVPASQALDFRDLQRILLHPMTAWLLAGALVAGMLLFHLFPHLQVFMIAADDFLLGIDAGQRVLDGHLPSRDWPSAIGPLFALLNALPLSLGLPMDLGQRSLDAGLLVLLLPCLLIAGRGLPSGILAAMAALATAILLTQYDLLSLDRLFFAVAYNRWANAFLFVPLVWLAAETIRPTPSKSADIAVGIAVAILAFTKANAGMAAGLLLLPGLWLHRPQFRRLLPLAAPGLLLAVPLVATGILLPYLQDLLDAAQSSGSRLPYLFGQLFGGLFLAVFVSLLLLLRARRRLDRPDIVWIAAWAVAVLFLGNLQNHTATIPGLAAVALLFGARLWPADEPGRKIVLPFLVVGMAGAAVLTVEAASGIRPSADALPMATQVSPHFPRVALLVPPEGTTRREGIIFWHSADTVRRWSDTQDLVVPGETILTVGQANVALIAGGHAPRGSFLWQDPVRNWVPAHDADPWRRLQGACAVLVRQTPRVDMPEDAILVSYWRDWLARHATPTRQGQVYERFELNTDSCRTSSPPG